MLEPDQRSLLVDGLRPPPGMTLDRALGTTFSLDLEALLVAPLTFALFDARLAEDGSRRDPLAILEAVRRHAGNIDLFCQAGQISLPAPYQPIVAHLEDCVHQVAVPLPRRIFHPKVWVLRFTGPAGSTLYRLLVLSRNLTFSRSWDTLVQLDGTLASPSEELARQNAPLVEFVGHLPAIAVQTSRRFSAIAQLADELRRVRWEIPEGFARLDFVALGVPGVPPARPSGERVLAVSPFASAAPLRQLSSASGADVLISRVETLDRVPLDVIQRFARVFVLNPSAEAADTMDASLPADEELAERAGETLVGLHAKLYITETGDQATVTTGSPNATDAAFGGNIEFAVALTGSARACGIDAFLGGGVEHQTMEDLFDPYLRVDAELVEPTEADRVALLLEEIARQLAAIAFTLRVEVENPATFSLILTADQAIPDLGPATLGVWPISRRPAREQLGADQEVALTFTGFSLHAITSFLALELTSPRDDGDITSLVVVNARLVGAPDDRHQRILTDLLKSKSDVLRYLLFLLADLGDEQAAIEAAHLLATEHSGDGYDVLRLPLFESIVRALARNPESLDHIHRLIDDLQQTDAGAALLPDGLAGLWPEVWAARQRVVRA